jgi:hypothetical protein
MVVHETYRATCPAVRIKRATNDDRIESIESSDLVYGDGDGIKAACFEGVTKGPADSFRAAALAFLKMS